jgi:hypothetical protein
MTAQALRGRCRSSGGLAGCGVVDPPHRFLEAGGTPVLNRVSGADLPDGEFEVVNLAPARLEHFAIDLSHGGAASSGGCAAARGLKDSWRTQNTRPAAAGVSVRLPWATTS